MFRKSLFFMEHSRDAKANFDLPFFINWRKIRLQRVAIINLDCEINIFCVLKRLLLLSTIAHVHFSLGTVQKFCYTSLLALKLTKCSILQINVLILVCDVNYCRYRLTGRVKCIASY